MPCTIAHKAYFNFTLGSVGRKIFDFDVKPRYKQTNFTLPDRLKKFSVKISRI